MSGKNLASIRRMVYSRRTSLFPSIVLMVSLAMFLRELPTKSVSESLSLQKRTWAIKRRDGILFLRGGMNAAAPRRDAVKQSMDENSARRQREDYAIELRKNKRESQLNKRRVIVMNQTQANGGDKDAYEPVPTLKDLPAAALGLKSDRIFERYKAAKTLRKLLSVHNPPASEAIEAGVLPPLVTALQQSESTELQFEAAWALTNIASTDHTMQVVQAGAVPHLVPLLNSPSADVREQAGWCLGNIAGDCPELRNLVLEANALDPILANIRQPASLSLLRNLVWALSNLCRGKPMVSMEVTRKAVPLLSSILLQCSDEDTLIDACWSLSYISDHSNENIELLLENRELLKALVKQLQSRSYTLIAPALRALGNIVTGTDEQTQAVIDAGILPHLLNLLQHPKKSLRKETCWLISNIAAGNSRQITALMGEPRLIAEVLQQLSWGQWDVRQEAAWAIANLCMSKDHTQQVVEMGAIRPLCELLTASDVSLVLVVLNAIESILQVSEENGYDYDERLEDVEALDKLEDLQRHKHEEVYIKAYAILERYFGGDEDAGED